ncbi:hypothetical protein [Runella sp. CRIBMP]|uniref:hypothetical protein n=1 Tax=Runella sp. CRIBMP TaxID=2683261 RepID=UPI0019804D8F|nr:hypothetical protein [Runella sp. CRIBMP]
MKRIDFLQKIAFGTGLAAAPQLIFAQQEKPAAYAPDLVRDFVGAGHKDLAKIQTMHKEHPNLLFAAWDWGGGDFETALEAAGHVGNKEIANYLLAQGARPNIFVLTMLGKTALVKPQLEAMPQLITSKGAHGFSLLHHAQRGGEDAKELLDYLQSKGLKEVRFKLW